MKSQSRVSLKKKGFLEGSLSALSALTGRKGIKKPEVMSLRRDMKKERERQTSILTCPR